MSFSYSGDPATSDLDEVRLLVHDVDEAAPLLSDEEVTWVLARQSTVYDEPLMAAAICAEIIAARYAGEISITADGVSISGDQLQTKWAALAASLRATYKALAAAGGAPYAGGVERGERRQRGVRPLAFGKAMHDNTRAGAQDYGERGSIPEWPGDDGGLNTWLGS